ncbi:uncharacterized protein LODBEIA_P25290 [Lodderomyces beijingensis]|uniref:Sphingoid long-chain base transporter RSB1 n=1 Tax=Lodderomyces beijingensis TaxID=1775926 RepID=A0ABP0ZJI9_9ASCO
MSALANMASWTPSSVPTSTTLTSIATSHASALHKTISSVVERAATETDHINLISLSQAYRGAMASLTIISAEGVLATETAPSIQAQATQAIFNATLNLKDLVDEENIFGYNPDAAGNGIYLAIFAIIFGYIAVMCIWSRYWWFNVTFFCGFFLEMLGFIGRILAIDNTAVQSYYIMQLVCLTIAPAFIMAGIYFIFGQLVVIHGRQYSVLRPMWYSYFFIASDVVSLIIQAGGGGAASVASSNHTDAKPGTNTMIAGIAVQVFAMSIFLVFWFEFLNRIYFKNSAKPDPKVKQDQHPLEKRSFGNFFKLLLNTKSVREYRHTHLEKFYNAKFASVRTQKLFDWLPLAMTIAVVVVYIRCVYRVVELAMGFSGYLYEHEVYVLVLDAAMIAICGIVFLPFHPIWVFGKKNIVKLASIKKNLDEHEEKEDGSEDGDVDTMRNDGAVNSEQDEKYTSSKNV